MAKKRTLKKSLGFFPTPLVRLVRLEKELGGPRLLMKRDDQTGLALGGNKTRKLEYLLGEAVAQECDAVITGGAVQSNHCRQTAAAAAACGLACHLVLGGDAPEIPEGNLLLDHVMGATIHWSGALRKGEQIPEIADQLVSEGLKPYIIPYGGSSATGAMGFVEAVKELDLQLRCMEELVTHIVFPSSSGGTQAGLTVGKVMLDCSFELIGIGIDKDEAGEGPFKKHVLDLTKATAERMEVIHPFALSDITIKEEYLGEGYGVMGDAERQAIRLVARSEAILLDPVYTGRAMAGLIDMIQKRAFSTADTVLFWHTGGTPALFTYARRLAGEDDGS